MSNIKNLLLTTALVSTTSITNAASITNGDFSEGSFGWNVSQKAGNDSTFNQVIGGQWSASQTYNAPEWSGFSDAYGSSILSQEIGEINNGDILSFDHTNIARLFFYEMVDYTDSPGFVMDTSVFGDALSNVNFSLSLRHGNSVSNLLTSSFKNVANSLPGKPISYIGGENYMLGSSQADSYSFNLSEFAGQNGRLLFTFNVDGLETEAEYYVDHIEELTSFTLLSQLDNVVITNEVPVPAAAWLFGSALAGLGVLRRRK